MSCWQEAVKRTVSRESPARRLGLGGFDDALGELVGDLGRGKLGDTLIVEATCDEFLEHTPVERQCTRFAREGVEVAPQTLGRSVAAHIDLLMPVARHDFLALLDALCLRYGTGTVDRVPRAIGVRLR